MFRRLVCQRRDAVFIISKMHLVYVSCAVEKLRNEREFFSEAAAVMNLSWVNNVNNGFE